MYNSVTSPFYGIMKLSVFDAGPTAIMLMPSHVFNTHSLIVQGGMVLFESAHGCNVLFGFEQIRNRKL